MGLLEDQRLFSGTAHKVFLKCQLSLKDPYPCLMKLLMPLPKVPLQSLVVVIPLLYLRKFQDLLTNSLTSVPVVVPLLSLWKVSNCLVSLPSLKFEEYLVDVNH